MCGDLIGGAFCRTMRLPTGRLRSHGNASGAQRWPGSMVGVPGCAGTWLDCSVCIAGRRGLLVFTFNSLLKIKIMCIHRMTPLAGMQ